MLAFSTSVVEQLAARVIDVVPSAFIIKERCLGFFTHWSVTTSFMHACNVAITLLQNEQVNFIVGVVFSVPQLCKYSSQSPAPHDYQSHRDHPRLCVSVQGVFQNPPMHLLPLPQAFCIGLWRSSACRKCFPTATPHFCVTFGYRVRALLVCKSNACVLTRVTRTAGIRHPGIIRIYDDAFRLPHTRCFNSGGCRRICRRLVFESFSAFRSVFLSRHRSQAGHPAD